MKHVALIGSLVAGLGAGCVTEEAPELGTAEAHQEVLVDPPMAAAWCNSCTGQHIVGDPARVMTSFYGYCKTPGWPLEYPCMPQGYALTITCTGGQCDPTPAGGSEDGLIRVTEVTLLDPGPITIHVHIDNHVFDLWPITSTVPDEVRVTCGTGISFDQPCPDVIPQPGARLVYSVYSHGQLLAPGGRFEIDDSLASLQLGDHGEWWYVTTPGVHHLRATYGTATLEHEITVAAPVPPPPPPPPPVPRTIGRAPMPGGDVLR